jgi:hypothetical protein
MYVSKTWKIDITHTIITQLNKKNIRKNDWKMQKPEIKIICYSLGRMPTTTMSINQPLWTMN